MRVRRSRKESEIRGFFSRFVSDRLYLKIRHLRRLKQWPDTRNAATFNEKLLNYKLQNKANPLFTRLADKIAAKDYVRGKVGDQYVTPLLWSGIDGALIPFADLPRPYIIKSSHGSSQNIKVTDLDDTRIDEIARIANAWISSYYGVRNREFQYWDIPRRILVEPMLETKTGNPPKEYKLFVFAGTVKMIQVDVGSKRLMMDKKWQPFAFSYKKPRAEHVPECPPSLAEMIKVAEILAADLEFVRVDLYDLDGNVRFSELTFSPESGLGRFKPASADRLVGSFWP